MHSAALLSLHDGARCWMLMCAFQLYVFIFCLLFFCLLSLFGPDMPHGIYATIRLRVEVCAFKHQPWVSMNTHIENMTAACLLLLPRYSPNISSRAHFDFTLCECSPHCIDVCRCLILPFLFSIGVCVWCLHVCVQGSPCIYWHVGLL